MKREQIPLFEMQSCQPPMDVRVAMAKASIARLFEENVPICTAFSGGKDSTVCADLVLNTAREQAASGRSQPVVIVTTSDTLVENPEIAAHFRVELRKMAVYGQKHGFRVITRIATPSLLSTWQMKVLTGRGLPSFAGQGTDCSIDLKVRPQAVLRRKLFKEIEETGMKEPVTCLGTRFDESKARAQKMRFRRENASEPVRNKDGDLILSPICDWSTDEVFEYLATRPAGEAFSTFQETLRIYAHSEGQGCAIVASSIQEGMSKRKKGGCGARHGCFMCQQSTDKSLENMIEYDERYEYARGLNKLNKFIRNTRYDWSRRHWVGRTIKAGYIAIQPDTYHPRMVREIFRYMIQLQYDEEVRAKLAFEEPKFQLFTPEMVLALDAYWSLTGMARPFSAWADVDDICCARVRYDIPDVEQHLPQAMPAARFLHVGREWDDTASMWDMTGLRDPYLEALLEVSACAPELEETSSGHAIWAVDTDSSFQVNTESVEMIQQFEMDNLLRQYRQGAMAAIPGSITHGYKWYIMYGAIQLSPAQKAKHDEILRRTAHKDRIGLSLDYDIDDLLQKSVRFSDLPKEARDAWSKKATTSSAQADLL